MNICEACGYPYSGATCGNPACRAGVNATPANLAAWDRKAAEREKDARDPHWRLFRRDP